MSPNSPQGEEKDIWSLIVAFLTIVLALLTLVVLVFCIYVVITYFHFRGENLGNSASNGTSNAVACQNVTAVKIDPKYLPWVKQAADKWLNGDQAELIALIQIESNWDPKAKNKNGKASGFGQFQPGTAGEMKEFTGGDDGTGRTWTTPSQSIVDSVNPPLDDPRFDPERAIFAVAHKLHDLLPGHNNDLRQAYEIGYHTYSDATQEADAKSAGERLIKTYNELLAAGGGCTQTGGGAGGAAGASGDAVNGGYLKVPGVKEGQPHQCGAASTMMVVLYYNPTFNDSTIYDRSSNSSVTTGCVAPLTINNNTNNKDWTRTTVKSFEPVKKSLAGGDPVVMFSAPGAVFDGTKHIFVIVGYDPKDDLFWINNPKPYGCECYPNGGPIKSRGSKHFTTNWLSQFWGTNGGTYATTFFIRQKYLK